jgi:hypothetical protein
VLTRRYRGLSQVDRAAFSAFAWHLKGRFHKFYSPLGFPMRGAFTTSEMVSNPYFADGTTGFSFGTNITGSVHDRVARVQRNLNDGTTQSIIRMSSAASVTQYASYCARAFVSAGECPIEMIDLRAGSSGFGSDYARSGFIDDLSMHKIGVVPLASTMHLGISQGDISTMSPAAFHVHYFSLHRAPLFDRGSNLLLNSDAFQTTWVPTRSSVSANSDVAPTGNTVADSLVEDTSNNTHFISQDVTVSASTALDCTYSVSVHAGGRSFCRVSMIEGTSSHQCFIDVNLTSGATGTATASGANWTNPRAFVVDQGDGWWQIHIVGRKVSATTTITCRVYMASALGTTSYLGNGSNDIVLYRGCFQLSALPSRPVSAGSTQNTVALTGDLLYLKGLPASTTGLLLPGDSIVIGDNWHIIRSVLTSDAAGLGACRIEPALANDHANDTPVELVSPMPAWLLEDDSSYENLLGAYADFDLNMGAVYE